MAAAVMTLQGREIVLRHRMELPLTLDVTRCLVTGLTLGTLLLADLLAAVR